ncbi:MAG: hypothetical protein A3K77_04600 [Euryarchaeota archaeon RBG_13_31_8]|nr:MAG: hypothetical protein A3K77_04600 [Euryarchaeota archaeon RBG_13_31_8]
MLLGYIFQAMPVWNKLVSMSMSPKMAYTILKYTQKINDEFVIIEKQRISLIHELTKTKNNEEASIPQGTPEFEEYVQRMNVILEVESTLKPLDMSLEQFIDAINSNALTVNDLRTLEPFFS